MRIGPRSTLALAAALCTTLTASRLASASARSFPLVRSTCVACFATLGSLRHAAASSPIPPLGRRAASSSSGSSGSATSAGVSQAAMTGVDVETPSGQRLHFVWAPEVNSTQDGMRQLLAEGAAPAADVVALGAAAQTKGRGTSGRAWVGLQGNVFLTLAIPTTAPSKDVGESSSGGPLFPFPITLLPLRIGTLVAREVTTLLPAEKRGLVNLKWPNDVLVGDDKVSGLLIEMEGGAGAGHYLVGIGVNLAQAPAVPTTGADRGRTATSLAQHGAALTSESARELSLAIATAVTEWFGARAQDSAAAVKAEWEALAVWGKEYRRRDDGSVVVPLALEADGRLKVRDPATGAVSHLVAEYLH